MNPFDAPARSANPFDAPSSPVKAAANPFDAPTPQAGPDVAATVAKNKAQEKLHGFERPAIQKALDVIETPFALEQAAIRGELPKAAGMAWNKQFREMGEEYLPGSPGALAYQASPKNTGSLFPKASQNYARMRQQNPMLNFAGTLAEGQSDPANALIPWGLRKAGEATKLAGKIPLNGGRVLGDVVAPVRAAGKAVGDLSGALFNKYHTLEQSKVPNATEFGGRTDSAKTMGRDDAVKERNAIFKGLSLDEQWEVVHRFEGEAPPREERLGSLYRPALTPDREAEVNKRVQLLNSYEKPRSEALVKNNFITEAQAKSRPNFFSRKAWHDVPVYERDPHENALSGALPSGMGGFINKGFAKGSASYPTLYSALKEGEELDPFASPATMYEEATARRQTALRQYANLQRLGKLGIGETERARPNIPGGPLMAREPSRYYDERPGHQPMYFGQDEKAQQAARNLADRQGKAIAARRALKARNLTEMPSGIGAPALLGHIRGLKDKARTLGRNYTTAQRVGYNLLEQRSKELDALNARIEKLGKVAHEKATAANAKALGAAVEHRDRLASQLDKLKTRVEEQSQKTLGITPPEARPGFAHTRHPDAPPEAPEAHSTSRQRNDAEVRVPMQRTHDYVGEGAGAQGQSLFTPKQLQGQSQIYTPVVGKLQRIASEIEAMPKTPQREKVLRILNSVGERAFRAPAKLGRKVGNTNQDLLKSINRAMSAVSVAGKDESSKRILADLQRMSDQLKGGIGRAEEMVNKQRGKLRDDLTKTQTNIDELTRRYQQAQADTKLRKAIRKEINANYKAISDRIFAHFEHPPESAEPGTYVRESEVRTGAPATEQGRMWLHKDFAQHISDAGKAGEPLLPPNLPEGAYAVGRLIGGLNDLARTSIIAWFTTHGVWNLGSAFLSEGGKLDNLTRTVDAPLSAERAAEAGLQPGATWGDYSDLVGAAPNMATREIGLTGHRAAALQTSPDDLAGTGRMPASMDLARGRNPGERVRSHVMGGVDKAATGYMDANNKLVFHVFERHYATELFRQFVEDEGMQVGDAVRRVRKALGDSQNITQRERMFNKLFFFYPWMKTVLPHWLKQGFINPKTWAPWVNATQQEHEQTGDTQGNAFAPDLWKTPEGDYFRINPLPQRVLNSEAQALEAIPDFAFGRMGHDKRGAPTPLNGFGAVAEDMKPLATYIGGHTSLGVGLARKALLGGDMPWDQMANPDSSPGDQLKEAAGTTLKSLVAPLDIMDRFKDHPLEGAVEFAGGLQGSIVKSQQNKDLDRSVRKGFTGYIKAAKQRGESGKADILSKMSSLAQRKAELQASGDTKQAAILQQQYDSLQKALYGGQQP